MAKNVIAQPLGGEKKVLDDVYTLLDVKNKLALTGNYTATVNGNPQSDDYAIEEGDFVSLAPAVKGGLT